MEKLTPRHRYEQAMRAVRSPLAVHESDSGGRKVTESSHPYRTCFQRDRDRIIHCSAFRRLDFKTQVFIPHTDDHFRTRMTHTLEVAQIGRDLGRALGLNEDLIEAVALAHDLGHSPFGHVGESTLDELMKNHGGFEHNRQSLRVVDRLEHPYPNFYGLNLCQIVRECLAKHETRYDHPSSEEFNPEEMPPLEGQLVDLADEIAYTAADLEDSLNCGWIQEAQLVNLKLWQRAWEKTQATYAQAKPIHRRIRTVKSILTIMADDLIRCTETSLRKAGIASLEGVRQYGKKLAHFSPKLRKDADTLQKFLLENVYTVGPNAERASRCRQVLRDLFTLFLEKPSLMPTRYRNRIASSGPHRIVCDYLAGMTDRYCLEEHKKHFGGA